MGVDTLRRGRRAALLFDRVVGLTSLTFGLVAAALLFVTFVLVQYEVVVRYIFNAPTSWTHETNEYAIAWIGFLGAGYVLRIGRHLEIDILTMRLAPTVRCVLGVITDLIAAAFCAYATWKGADFVRIAYVMGATSASEIDTPLYIPYLAIPLGFAVLGLEFLARLPVRLGWVDRPATDASGGHA